jgi:SAM-dependent methyltransferase
VLAALTGMPGTTMGMLRSLAIFAGLGMALAAEAQTAPRTPDVAFVPTPEDVVAGMLRLANVKRDDVVYDLGSGDGRIVIAAAKGYGARGVGIDIDPERVEEAYRNARAARVADRVRFLNQDLFESDISEATVVTLYLLPRLNLRLRPKLLAELKPGTRVVSHGFDMGDWRPERTAKIGSTTIYLWTIP